MNIGINDVLKQVRLFFIPYLILLCACLTVKVMFTKEAIYFAVNSLHSPLADQLAPYVTDMGNGWTAITPNCFFNGKQLCHNLVIGPGGKIYF
jgi:hypothetical protein